MQSTASPPPDYNFAFTPVIHDIDSWWDMKRRGYKRPLTGYKPIHMPRNTGTVTLRRQPWVLPETVPFGALPLKPLCGGETLAWQLIDEAAP